MKKIYLFCSNGMSTSILASNTQDIANKHNLPIEVVAFPHNKLEEIINSKSQTVFYLDHKSNICMKKL